MKSNSLFYFLWGVLCLVSSNLFAQDWDFNPHGNNVQKLTVSGQWLWVTTRDGVYKLQTTTGEIVHFNTENTNLKAGFLTDIAVTSEDSVWVGYYYFGAGRMGSDSVWNNYQYGDSPLKSNFVRTISEAPSGAMYLGTYYGGVSIYDHGVWSFMTSENSGLPISNFSGGITKILFEDDDNDINAWFGTKYHGVFHRTTTSDTLVYYDVFNSEIPDEHFSAMALDANKRVWVGTHAGLAVKDGEDWHVFKKDNSPLLSDFINDIVVDNDSIAWVATLRGLVGIPTETMDDFDTWQVFSTDNSPLPEKIIDALAVDTLTGDLWVGMYSKGVLRYNGSSWESFLLDESTVLGNDIISLNYMEDSTLLVATRASGLGIWKDEEWSILDKSSGLLSDQIHKAAKDTSGNIWVAYRFDGLTRWDGNTVTHFNSTNTPMVQPYNVINDIYIDPNNIIWLAVNGGFWEINPVDSIWNYHPLDCSSIGLLTIEPDENGFWMGGGCHELLHYDGQTLESYNTPDNAFNNIVINDIKMDEWDNVWIGTAGNGLWRKTENDDWLNMNSTNSTVYGNNISSLEYTPDSTLWVGTVGSGIYTYHLGLTDHFDVYTGHLPQNNISDFAWDGQNLWIGLPHLGVGKYKVDIFVKPQTPLEVPIMQIVNASMNLYPNPVVNVLHVDLDIPTGGNALLSFFSEDGHLINEYAPGFLPTGKKTIDVDISDYPSGNYYVELFINSQHVSKLIHVQ